MARVRCVLLSSGPGALVFSACKSATGYDSDVDSRVAESWLVCPEASTGVRWRSCTTAVALSRALLRRSNPGTTSAVRIDPRLEDHESFVGLVMLGMTCVCTRVFMPGTVGIVEVYGGCEGRMHAACCGRHDVTGAVTFLLIGLGLSRGD
ncbi:hypothetical protein BS17DRAFT_770257 [Gyrodon lividus]|nr:hypothetical protein BS17DRAFT_770257 [Gyrodon lividus]